MRLIAKVIRILLAKFHCNRLTTVHDIQDHVSLIFWTVYCSELADESEELPRRGCGQKLS